MQINILTLFPEYFEQSLKQSIIGKAQDMQQVNYNVINIRDFAYDKHHITDDHPYGGGPGMVMKIEPIHLALESLGVKKGQENGKIILTSAKGQLWSQSQAQKYSKLDQLTIICGHYQGVDQRVVDYLVDGLVRIGDYILTGGEPAALVMIDSVTRLISGVLGNPNSLKNETNQSNNFQSPPLYTKPRNYQGYEVPKVLLSGHHAKIEQWRQSHTKNQTENN